MLGVQRIQEPADAGAGERKLEVWNARLIRRCFENPGKAGTIGSRNKSPRLKESGTGYGKVLSG